MRKVSVSTILNSKYLNILFYALLLGKFNYLVLFICPTYRGYDNKQKAYEILKTISQYPVISKSMVDDIKIYNPLFSIRNEPEFQQIVQDMESKYWAEYERVKKWLEEQGKL